MTLRECIADATRAETRLPPDGPNHVILRKHAIDRERSKRRQLSFPPPRSRVTTKRTAARGGRSVQTAWATSMGSS